MSLGSLALTGSQSVRKNSAALLNHVIRLPYDGYAGASIVELERFATMVRDPSAGIAPPAAFIVETIQGEGGLNVASVLWLQSLARIARQLGALLIVDEVQTGCGRTGPFFSFQRAGIQPDIVCLAKSLSGFGLPMSLVLIKREHDVWEPGEHNGTFRGNNLAFVTATQALKLWTDPQFKASVDGLNGRLDKWCEAMVAKYPAKSKGLGAMRGLAFDDGRVAGNIAKEAFARGLLLECCGPNDEVVKIMPPLTIERHVLEEGIEKLESAMAAVLLGAASRVLRKKGVRTWDRDASFAASN
jgi:diaminobutyrate-2-oxoglutarate transaminase